MEKLPENLLEEIQDVIPLKSYSYSTGKIYIPKPGA